MVEEYWISNISFNLKKIGRREKIRRTIILVDTSCITKNIATVGKTGCASNRAHACMLAYTRAEIHFHLSHTPHTPRPGQTAKQLVATPVDPSQLLRNPWLNFSRRILGEKPPLLLLHRDHHFPSINNSSRSRFLYRMEFSNFCSFFIKSVWRFTSFNRNGIIREKLVQIVIIILLISLWISMNPNSIEIFYCEVKNGEFE